MSEREWSIIGVLAVLLAVVVIVGVASGDIDKTSIALGLMTAITGIVTGLIAKGAFGSSGKRKNGDES